jgi:hypothetical protein
MTDYEYEDSTNASYGQEVSTPQYAAPQNGSATPKPAAIQKKPMGFVGFSNLPNQVHRKSVRKGFQFTAMVVGPSPHSGTLRCPRSPATRMQASLVSANLPSSIRSLRPRSTHVRRRSSPRRSVRAPLLSRVSVPVSGQDLDTKWHWANSLNLFRHRGEWCAFEAHHGRHTWLRRLREQRREVRVFTVSSGLWTLTSEQLEAHPRQYRVPLRLVYGTGEPREPSEDR